MNWDKHLLAGSDFHLVIFNFHFINQQILTLKKLNP